MKKFYVIWRYAGNSSKVIEVDSDDPRKAADVVTGHLDDDFKNRSRIYVFGEPPLLEIRPKYDWIT